MASTSRRLALAAASCVLAGGPVIAGEFSVNPIRLELASTVRSGVIAVRNDGNEKLSFQLQAAAWTQDGAGKDQYGETNDLVFFPKLMTVEPGQEGVIRVGARNPVTPVEKTYRLFIEELPGPAKAPEGAGAKINVLIRFGAPIFLAPLKAQDSLEIEALSVARGLVTLSARNSGNRHHLVQGIHVKGSDASGGEVYALTLADRYLLAGTAKSYTTSIAADVCAKLAALNIEIKTDKLNVKRKLDMNRAMCP